MSRMPDSITGWLTIKQVAEKLGKGEYTIRKLIRDKKLLAKKEGRRWLIHPKDLEEYIMYEETRNTPIKPQTQ